MPHPGAPWSLPRARSRQAHAAEHRPDCPPKTPPPTKRPPSPWPPEPQPKDTLPRPAARIANRRAASWALENAPWSPTTARKHVTQQLTTWGYRPDAALGEIVTLLAREALTGGGRRISVHLADQNQQVLVLVLNHTAGPGSDEILAQVAALGAVSCGPDTPPDGRRLWAVIDL
ncbi:hypothetical protein C3486_26960 [Streptomyces sp. Ru73]|uniref:hypothetical protein n=1 Tax=Streptomyces sp. Ru73 TaxID=2080748 RepID=UPI000CDD1E3E|nr:hypothetical protein [Streptomyces sp. Ru73]POX37730.1 hypothetical protein C3486_26960 [Streptomyces sp. Ru73]